jgi:predicted Kef-type K+ transport protein
MRRAALAGISILTAICVGFNILIILSPDPTGVLVVAGTIAVSIVLSPIFYSGIQRIQNRRSL